MLPHPISSNTQFVWLEFEGESTCKLIINMFNLHKSTPYAWNEKSCAWNQNLVLENKKPWATSPPIPTT